MLLQLSAAFFMGPVLQVIQDVSSGLVGACQNMEQLTVARTSNFNGHDSDDSGTDLLEVPTIYKAYFLGLCKGISPQNMALYADF